MSSSEQLRAFVVPREPSPRVKKFLMDNPVADWQDSLEFLVANWPQVTNGRINYLIEGGAAMKLYYPERRIPSDVDFITRSEDMKKEFDNAKRFDAKTIALWFIDRSNGKKSNFLTFPPDSGVFIFDYHDVLPFRGSEVVVMNKVALAASKMLPFRRNPYHREHNREDLALLADHIEDAWPLVRRVEKVCGE